MINRPLSRWRGGGHARRSDKKPLDLTHKGDYLSVSHQLLGGVTNEFPRWVVFRGRVTTRPQTTQRKALSEFQKSLQ